MRRLPIVTLVVLLALVEITNAGSQAKPSVESLGRITRLLEDSGYRYSKLSDAAWRLTFKGEHRDSLDVFLSAGTKTIALTGVVAYKNDVKDAGAAALALLRFNHDSDYPAAVDGDDDYVVSSYHELAALTSDSFKAAVKAIAGAADDAFAAIASASTSSKGSATTGLTGARATASYTTSANATARLEILGGRGAVAFDPRKWQERKTATPNRFELLHAQGDGYAIVIAERIQIELPALKELALKNAQAMSPDVVISSEETRTVNDVDVLMMRLDGTAGGVKFTFLGYYWSGAAGSVQVLTYTGQNLVDEYRPDFEEFLNGFQIKR